MKLLCGLALSLVFLGLPDLVSAQVISPNNTSGSSLQGSSSGLQQPISGFQGTSPSSLSAPSLSKLNQNTIDPSSSSIRLKPSVTTTNTTEPKKGGGLLPGKFILLVLISAIAGFFLWKQSFKLFANYRQG